MAVGRIKALGNGRYGVTCFDRTTYQDLAKAVVNVRPDGTVVRVEPILMPKETYLRTPTGTVSVEEAMVAAVRRQHAEATTPAKPAEPAPPALPPRGEWQFADEADVALTKCSPVGGGVRVAVDYDGLGVTGTVTFTGDQPTAVIGSDIQPHWFVKRADGSEVPLTDHVISLVAGRGVRPN